MQYFHLTGADKLLENGKAKAALYFDKGYIGMFSCEDVESGTDILLKSIHLLQENGKRKIIAPIDGNTWFTYRLISFDSCEAPFPLEAQNPLWYNECFKNAGFHVLQKYYSDIFDMPKIFPRTKEISTITIRPVDLENLTDEMRIIYDLSMGSFDNNFLFSNISFEKFMVLYSKVTPMLDKDLICIAQKDTVPVGFLFCLDGGNNRLVMKSMAVHKDYRGMGLGTLLADCVLRKASLKGFKSVIGAYIKEGNYSGNIISKYHSRKIREYCLYGLEV